MAASAAKGPRYRQTPLWRDSSRFLVEVETAVRTFPRYHKYTLGSDLRRQAMNICRLVARAAQSPAGPERARLLEQLVWQVEDVKMSLQLGKELEVWGAQGDGLRLPAGGSPVERPGLGTGLAWPVARGAALRRALRRRGQPFCQIVEDGYLRGGMKQRSLRWIFTPLASHAAACVPTASPTISPVSESIRGGS